MNKPYHHGNLRAALLEAARARLSEGSEADLSLRDLAARVGVSVNATYRHFESKEALLVEICTVGFDALRARMQEAIEACGDASARERLRRAGHAYAEFARHDPGLYRLMFGRRGRFGTHERFRAAANAAFNVVIDCVAAVRGESPDSADVVKAAVGTWALVHGYATLDIGGYLAGMPDPHRPSVGEALRLLAVDA